MGPSIFSVARPNMSVPPAPAFSRTLIWISPETLDTSNSPSTTVPRFTSVPTSVTGPGW